jgi:hypothetical protein
MKKINSKDKSGGMLVSVLSLGFVVTLVSVYLYQSFQIDLIMKEMHQMHQYKKQLLSETESLQAEVGRLSNVDVISKKAQENFGLHFSRDQIMVLKIDDSDDLINIKKQLALEDKNTQHINAAGIQ